MKRLLVVLLLSGCLAVDAPPIDRQQQAVGGVAELPDTTGEPNARLGSSLSTCAFRDGNLVMASAPGVKKINSMGLNGTLSPASPYDFDNGGSISCASVDFPDGGSRSMVLIAGPVSQTLSGPFFAPVGLGASKRAAASDGLGAFVGGSVFSVGNATTGAFITIDAGHRLVDLAFESPTSVVVAPNDAMKVTRFFLHDGGWSEGTSIATSDYDSHVIVGDVSPSPGREIIVSGVNMLGLEQVQVYAADGTLLDSRTGTNGFGSSLAIEKGLVPGGDALWVGEPGSSSVWRFSSFTETKYLIGLDPLSEAGAAIAVAASRDVWVGAPGYDNARGAVYFIPAVDAGLSACTTTADCNGCNQVCSGQYCSPSFCPLNQNCVQATKTCQTRDAGIDAGIDAGFVDGGVSDAGVVDGGAFDGGVVDGGLVDGGVVDGGVIDAGSIDSGVFDAGGVDVDAGVSDAGLIDGGAQASDAGTFDDRPRQFASCGCSSGDALMGLLALALMFRRSLLRSELPSP